MSSTTVRIRDTTHKILKTLSSQTGESIQSILDRAIDAYAREKFLNELNDDYARLRHDKKAWAEELDERKLWEVTLMDGLEDD